ncbi:bi-domain-containing oxidoreductase [Candidatus Berkelbacteria bacterium]|nr:bi-domain-containing oxidoreductase [Candidatus Berkelbacteria bacterium]
MKQVFSKVGAIVVEEVPAPTVDPGSVLIRTAHSLISAGTESGAIQSTADSLLVRALRNPALVKQGLAMVAKHGVSRTRQIVKEAQENAELLALGYSAAGEVVAVGDRVTTFRPGDRVAAAGAAIAAHAEVNNVPVNLVTKIPDGVPTEQACYTTVGAIALQGVRRADVRLGERVVVTGLGLIGQLTVQLLRAAGCQVFGIDTNPARVKLARSFGLSGSAIAGKDRSVARVLDWSSGVGADAVIITAGTSSSAPANEAMQMIRRKGRVVVVGAVGMDLERPDFYQREADFLISTSYGPGRYDLDYEVGGHDYPIAYVRWTENRNMQAFLDLLAMGRIDVASLTSRIFSIDEAPAAYGTLKDLANLPGVVLAYPPSERTRQTTSPVFILDTAPRPVGGSIGVALVGAGNFARAMHLPNLKEIADFRLVGIADRLGSEIQRLGRTYGAAVVTTDYRELLKRPDVDLVVITTRHNLHASMAIEALKAKKDVFVEKPLAMNLEETAAVIAAARRSKRQVMVGFNRRFSPLSVAMKRALGGLAGPAQILIRANAGPLPRSHWTVDPYEGGGRVIGEACHFLDYVLWLTGAKPVRLWARQIGTEGITHDTMPRDNVSATIELDDGSLAQLIYTALGSAEAPKERIEVYRDHTVAILEDFKSLTIVGSVKQTEILPTQDKGHRAELELVRAALTSGGLFPISLEESVRATIGSFHVLDSAKTGTVIEGDWLPTSYRDTPTTLFAQ